MKYHILSSTFTNNSGYGMACIVTGCLNSHHLGLTLCYLGSDTLSLLTKETYKAVVHQIPSLSN